MKLLTEAGPTNAAGRARPPEALRRFALLLALLVAVAVVRVVLTYPVFSQTADEPFHVATGVQWWATGEYGLDREHPPLARILFGLGPYLDGATVRPGQDVLEVANGYFYRDGVAGYVRHLAIARVPNLVFLVLLLIVTGVWTRRLFGDGAALLAVALLGALPPVLGHAGLATTDLAVTAALPLALFAFCRWLQGPSWRTALALGGAAGLGLLSKFSFLLFVPLAALGFVAAFAVCGLRPRRAHATVLLSVVVAVLSLWAGYRFSTGRLNEARRETFRAGMVPRVAADYAAVPGYEWVRVDLLERYHAFGRGVPGVDFVDWARAAGYPSPLAGRHGDTMRGAPPVTPPGLGARVLEPFRAGVQWVATHVDVPAPEFFAGADYVAYHSRTGHPSFFLGRYGDAGWWSYFPVVTFFKTPLALVLLALAGLAFTRRNPEAIGIALVPFAILLPAMTSSINIGVRHVLPMVPFVVMIAVFALRRFRRVVAAVVLVWYFVATALAHPDYLSYFNEAAGAHPERIALDSNLDWGQDLLRLADYAHEHPMQPLYVAYFGNADWRQHLPGALDLPRDRRVRGWIAVSEMALAFGGPKNEGEDLAWLKARPPVRRIGSSIRLYYVP
jgi:4-amino-4-deoxy-L-arabinose transferase-like glycosyltransferase